MAIDTFETITHSPQETQELGKKIAGSLKKGDIVALFGELGSGKTTMIQGISWGLGVSKDIYVNSPSFVILKEYRGKFPIYHFDLYRLKDFSELTEIGYPDLLDNKGVVLIEWAEKIEKYLSEYIRIEMKYVSLNEREIGISYSATRRKPIVGGHQVTKLPGHQ
ncbi:MAG: tRNA (adenosine(37)-N6)-threonylcarbamoyltransferase complex ATPase subunit type 1 TsaE [Candidatus Omnitrophica bacterium]|nr:tRNA (adenosine(37)-N6)-threonylcarbamoyltransferase complex ATPase subunit type 1 TsaE [Candidatus Omnitrophota bacterium]